MTERDTAITYVQGFRARSLVEYSLMKKCVPYFRLRQLRITHDDRYFLFLLVNVVFIFLLASTYWQLVRDLANSPAKIPEKLAQALQMGRAKSGISIISEVLMLMMSGQALFPLLRDPARWVAYLCNPGGAKLKSVRTRYHAVTTAQPRNHNTPIFLPPTNNSDAQR